jgi:phage terminase Nu1 subunit (DNA packaging protein)
MPLITQAEYARQRGVSRAAVTDAVKSGRICLIDGKIDPEVANIQWLKNTRTPKLAAPSTPDPVPDTAITQTLYDLQLARAKRETHEANLAEMKERQRAGELVELAQVHLAYTTLAAQLRAALERIPDKLSSRLAAESDEHTVHTLLLAELDQALLDMARSADALPAKLQEASRYD